MNKVCGSGWLGLFSSLWLTLGCVLLNYFWLPTVVSHPWFVWLGFFIFMSTALLELPLMVYVIHNLAQSDKVQTKRMAHWLVEIYVLFATLYAVPNLLLTDMTMIWLGLLIASTSFLRFGAAVVFLRDI